MDDKDIIALFFARSEQAVCETDRKYGKYCRYIAKNILDSDEDSEECVNDVYLKLWETIPPNRPEIFSAYAAAITRNTALNMYKARNRKKRRGEADIVFEELAEAIPMGGRGIADEIIIKDAVNDFLRSLDPDTRTVFMRRYWYMSTLKEIASDYKMPIGTVKTVLHRTRNRLKAFLKKEGVEI